MHISIIAEKIFYIGSWPVTNATLLSTIVLVLFSGIGLYLRRHIALVPGKLQSIFELCIEQILELMDAVLGDRRKSEKYLPLVMTIFLFVMISNWLGLLPGIGSIVVHAPPHGEEGARAIPLLRAPSADLNFTIALAIISLISIHIFGVAAIGFWKHMKKYFTLKNPIYTFVGLLEFISEFVKIISFSFRLFGNVFAGEVLLTIVGTLVPYILPLPFLFLEVFVGCIQAFIFAMLTLVFVGMATSTESAH